MDYDEERAMVITVWNQRAELCRAAPAGGDYRDAYEGAREDLLDWKGRALRAEAELRRLGYTGITPDSAPAGSGEVEKLVDDLILSAMGDRDNLHGCETSAETRQLRAALLRKLQQGADSEMAAIGKLIRTQDNRITESPIFAVEQKREYVTDAEYNDSRIVWVNDEGGKADAKEDADLEARYRRDYEEPRGWRRLAVFDVWEFVTACFTEQGCKDYIAANGHNLKETRIFAHGSYRNREWQAVRSHLIAASQGQEGGHASVD